jgi:hypothetical protein
VTRRAAVGFAIAAAACAAAAVIASIAPAPASAQSRGAAAGAARLEVIRPLRTATQTTLQFGRLQPSGVQGGSVTVSASAPAMRAGSGVTLLPGGTVSALQVSVTGEPGRAYRIAVPATATSTPGGYGVRTLTVATRTSGLVTTLRQAQLDAAGTDTVYVGATLDLPKGAKADAYAAQFTIAIAYE